MVTFNAGSYIISITNPYQNLLLLVLLCVLTVLAYLYMVHARGKRATHFGNMNTLRRVHGYKRFNVSPIVFGFKLIIIVLLFLIATNSLEVFEVRQSSNTDYVLLIDSSASMAKSDYSPNRLSAAKSDYPPNRLSVAKNISQNWIKSLDKETKIGYATFSQEIGQEVPLTTEKSVLLNQIKDTQINYDVGGTSLDFALNHAAGLFSTNPARDRVILLLTDAAEDVQDTTLASLRVQQIKVYAFGIGKGTDLSEVDEEFRDYYADLAFNFTPLQRVSQITNGVAYQVENASNLQQAITDATLDQLEVELNSSYYIMILIAVLSILEFVFYARFGAL